MSNPRSLGEIFQNTAKLYPSKAAFLSKEAGKYSAINWAEAQKEANALSQFLLKQGIRPGSKVAILSENRLEWALTDLAALQVGAISVPIYTSLTPSEIEYILQDCEAELVAVSNKILFEKLTAIQKNLPKLRTVIVFESALSVHKNEIAVPVTLFKEALTEGLNGNLPLPEVSLDMIASIIYTSGTTGLPKGVLLTHKNFISNILMCREALKMGETDSHLSFLPLSHVFERTAGYYLMIYIGAQVAYAENMDSIPQNILEVQPTFLLGVPRFYEKIKERVEQKVKTASSAKKALFAWARDLSARKRRLIEEGGPLGIGLRLELLLAEFLVFSKFKRGLGGHLRFGVSGGAPLSKDVALFFNDLGVLLLEGYGLTETSPVISANREKRYRFGSVGIPLVGVQVKITEEGEIVTKSDSVMQGYLNKKTETDAVLKEGWFYTGDLGQIDREGFLTITGRKKELIVTSGGKKVAPRPIEEALESDEYILRCVLYGEGKKFITALIIPQKEKIIEYANAQKIAYTDYAKLLKDSKIYQFIESRVEEKTRDLASFEKIKYFVLLENDFTQSAGELTPTLKVKREVVFSRYRTELEKLYEV